MDQVPDPLREWQDDVPTDPDAAVRRMAKVMERGESALAAGLVRETDVEALCRDIEAEAADVEAHLRQREAT